MENTNNPFDFAKLPNSFLSLINKPELAFQFFDMLPTPIEIFGADGVVIYLNRAWAEMVNIKDIYLVVGVYNYKTDPVCLEITGQEFVDRVFRGEAVTYPDFPAPIQDVYDRGVIDEKPWEAATMDMFFLPIWDGDQFVCSICFATVKNMYKGRADIVDAKKYIDQHWLDEFDPDTVAKSVNISPAHLRALFKQHAGMTMHDYYKKVKVDHIKGKLADRNLSIAEAFGACGENSRGAFVRTFKELTGMTPTEYRASINNSLADK